MNSANKGHYKWVFILGVSKTHLWSSIVPIRLTGHPTDETRGDADLTEGRDRDGGNRRHFGVEK